MFQNSQRFLSPSVLGTLVCVSDTLPCPSHHMPVQEACLVKLHLTVRVRSLSPRPLPHLAFAMHTGAGGWKGATATPSSKPARRARGAGCILRTFHLWWVRALDSHLAEKQVTLVARVAKSMELDLATRLLAGVFTWRQEEGVSGLASHVFRWTECHGNSLVLPSKMTA